MMLSVLRLAFWAATAFATVMALLPHPPAIPGTPSDKVQHMIAFLTLALLASIAYPRVSLLRIGLALSAFGAAIEFLQLIPALNRFGDFYDWLADSIAVGVALTGVYFWRQRRGTERHG